MGNKWCGCFMFVLVLVLVFTGNGQSKGTGNSVMNGDEIYQIDYHGPETHSSLAPPEISWSDPKLKHWTNKDANKSRKMKHG
ncbi:hypothetical protein J5N97_014815 [Dioscorea zingiberensis]|uniref:Uncharacterized protein n=1 Tax=Dioscorea zingiberensis TaxID=325984 RepID=A0A9D5CT25_9LILI|nr:hypothetical protein J5N97_014815 [Dioscorea zingiberensis]